LRAPRLISWSHGALALVAGIALFGLAFLFAITMPYHDWDAFAYGELSRRIATGGSLDPRSLGPTISARPFFLGLQGALWSVTGVSLTAGRLLSLGFALVAAIATSMLVRRGQGRLLAFVAFLSIPVFAEEAIAGLTDVPAAAAVAAVAAVALAAPFRRQWALTFVLALVGVLTKPSSVLPALFGLALALLLVEKPWPAPRLASSRLAALTAGVAVGVAYEWAIAIRLQMGIVAFLRAGTTGYYARIADSVRAGTLLRFDFLGPFLGLPLAFSLVYAGGRAVGLAHRTAGWIAYVLGCGYAIVAPFVSGASRGPFISADVTFTFVGFALVLAAVPFASEDLQPDRVRTSQLFLIALPPTIVWAWFGIYQNRLEAPAWPALAALIGLCLMCAVRVVHRTMGVASLALIPILLMAMWGSVVSLDGFHEPWWKEYRALGITGIFNRSQGTNIVLPAVSETVAALRAQVGRDGRIVASDPHFLYWFPNTTLMYYPTKCSDLADEDGFVLSTGDESRMGIRRSGGSPDPATWAACRNPTLRQLSDGSNGYAAFVVGR
jgi:hypothetical protein